MLMVIFGAGASYDSVHARPVSEFPTKTLPDRLPFAADLFADREKFVEALRLFPRCHPIVSYLRQPPAGESVEQVLQRLQDEGRQYPERLRQIAALRLYLQTMITLCEGRWRDTVHLGITNHVTLLDKIQGWRERTKKEPVWLVTFNYDRMLEDALRTIGVQIDDLPAFVNGDSYRLAKLHGSVNWGREVDTPLARLREPRVWDLVEELIELAPDLQVSRRYRLAPRDAQLPTVRLGVADPFIPLFPAIAIPVEKKDTYECPEEHVQALRRDLPNVDRVVTIGWRGTEQYFMALLKEHLPKDARLLVVAGSRAGANEVVLKFVLAGVPLAVVSSSSLGFSDFVVHREMDDFLTA